MQHTSKLFYFFGVVIVFYNFVGFTVTCSRLALLHTRPELPIILLTCLLLGNMFLLIYFLSKKVFRGEEKGVIETLFVIMLLVGVLLLSRLYH
jgi:hypothetical protein